MSTRFDFARFAGFTSPGTTATPDVYFDWISPHLSGAEVKVMNYLIRRTYGFRKERDAISLGQMMDGIVRRDGVRLDCGTGVGSKSTLLAALRSLEEKRLIVRVRAQGHDGRHLPTIFSLRFADETGTEGRSETAPRGDRKPDQALDRGAIHPWSDSRSHKNQGTTDREHPTASHQRAGRAKSRGPLEGRYADLVERGVPEWITTGSSRPGWEDEEDHP